MFLLKILKFFLIYRIKLLVKTLESILNLYIIYYYILKKINFSSFSLIFNNLIFFNFSNLLIVIDRELVIILIYIIY